MRARYREVQRGEGGREGGRGSDGGKLDDRIIDTDQSYL